MRALLCACAMVVAMTTTSATAQVLDFENLDGWADDNHQAALTAFLQTCDTFDAPDWQPICKLAADANASDASAKAFFELMFKPVLIGEIAANGQFDVVATVSGGGLSGQAGAVRHGISQALTKFEPGLRGSVKAAGFLTRDARVKERKHYGLKKARKAPQYSKR